MASEGQPAARYPGRAPIEAYGNGGFRFAGMSHRGSLLCLPQAIEAWPVEDAGRLRVADFAAIFKLRQELDFVLLGTGAEHRLAPVEVRDAFRASGLAFDVMATGAAARTYNVLLAEGRRVAAALIVVGSP